MAGQSRGQVMDKIRNHKQLSCFLLCTYRCFSNMLNLIFMNDVELFLDDDSFRKKTSSKLEFEKECENR